MFILGQGQTKTTDHESDRLDLSRLFMPYTYMFVNNKEVN